MKLPISALCLIYLVFTVFAERAKRQTNRCYTPDNYMGLCVPFHNCPSLLKLFSDNLGSHEVERFIRRAKKSCRNVVSRGESKIVCCSHPAFNVQTQPPFSAKPNNSILRGQAGAQQVQAEAPLPTTPRPIVTSPLPSTSAPASTRPINLLTSQAGSLEPRNTRPTQNRADDCIGPDDNPGSCKSLAECPVLLTRLQQNPKDQTYVQFLRLSNQICKAHQPIICCPKKEPMTGVAMSLHIPVTFSTIKPVQTDEAKLLSPDSCIGPDDNPGFCKSLAACPVLLTRLQQNPKDQTYAQFLRLSNQICKTLPPIVCCPNATSGTSVAMSLRGPVASSQIKPVHADETQRLSPVDCIGPDAKPGSCKSLLECPILLTLLQQNPTNHTYAQFLRLSNGVCQAPPPIICCPNVAPFTESVVIHRSSETSSTIKPVQTDEARLLTPEEGCGQSHVGFKKVVGGQPSQLGSWPWLALLAYETKNGMAFRCGGSLVTKRHIVTAAHCLNRNLRMARLGEHDIDSTTETQHVDVNVVRTARHPSYNSRNGHSDIAILYLANDITFTDTIGPVCVPDKVKFASRSLIGYTPFVAGWGRTKEGGESANVLQEVQLPILNNNECKERYRAQNRLVSENQFDNSCVCAGELIGGKDTCHGDSGGPLMLPEKTSDSDFYYTLIGVVSYGIGCARAGIPGVYANVPHFSDWIKEKIAEPA